MSNNAGAGMDSMVGAMRGWWGEVVLPCFLTHIVDRDVNLFIIGLSIGFSSAAMHSRSV